jgi:hypothetical protein
MNEPDDFDALLQERFDREHRHVAADPFIPATARRIRTVRRRIVGLRTALQAMALVAVVIASPWLIAGAARLNAVLDSSLARVNGLPGAWLLGGLAVVVLLLVSRARN